MEIPQDVVEALGVGRKIEAIKRLREARPMGLKEAKEAVEAWQAVHPEVAPPPLVGCLLPAPLCPGRCFLRPGEGTGPAGE